MESNPKLLMVLHLPPVKHGAAKVGGNIFNSTYINSRLDIDYIDLGMSKNLADVGEIRFSKLAQIFMLNLKVFWALLSKKYDLVYLTPTTRGFGIYKDAITVIIAKIFRKRIVVHLHNKGIIENSSSTMSRWAYKSIFDNSFVILQSLLLKSDFIVPLAPREFYIVSNGIEDESVPNNDGQPHNTLVILFLSNLFVSKGVFLFLEVLKRLESKGYNFEGRIIGKEGDISSSHLTKEIARMGLSSKVSFIGPLYGKKKFQEMTAADILVYPTLDDCFPLVIIEALSCGLPVIASAVGGIPDILNNGECGVLIPPGNIIEIEKQLEVLVQNQELRSDLSKKARSYYIDNFTIDSFEKNLTKTLSDIAHK